MSWSSLPNDILRDIYTKAVVVRNYDKKKAAIRGIALKIVDYLKIICDDKTTHSHYTKAVVALENDDYLKISCDDGATLSFSTMTDRLSIMKSCLGWVRQDGSGKYGSLSFRHGGYTQFNIENIDGEYNIKNISKENMNEFGKMVVESIKEEFNRAHVLVNKRRPTKRLGYQ